MSAEAELLKKAKSSLARYCALGERSPRQARDKLKKFRLSDLQIEKVIAELKHDGFLNESRFAAAFCNDKLKFNAWGKSRLKMELSGHQINPEVIESALDNIDEALYVEQIKQVLKKKLQSLAAEENYLLKKKKLTDFAIRKGFEAGIVFSISDELLSSLRQ
jgi:regulatory protein